MIYPTSTILQTLRALKPALAARYQVVRLGIFGSYASGLQTDSSDLDVLIEFEDHTENLFDKKEEIQKLLESTFQLQVDLCREKYIKPYFKEQIIKSAQYV
jgi:predicted nucleotidyltransferase